MTGHKVAQISSRQKAAIKKNAMKESVMESDYSAFKGLTKALDIAEYYGFIPIKTPGIGREDSTRGKTLCESTSEENFCMIPDGKQLSIYPEERLALLRTYVEKNMASWPQPVMVFYKRPSKKVAREFSLDILGNSRSVLEALIIKTSLSILEENGFENLCVEINSIGDRESFSRFERQLSNYYKKNIEELEEECRGIIKKDLFAITGCGHDKCSRIKNNSPKPICYLSDQSRQHFKEVLEHLESLEVLYKISDGFIGNKNFCSHTVFKITGNPAGKKDSLPETLAMGMRYNGLAKKIGLKKDVPGVGVSISLSSSTEKMSREKIAAGKKTPKIYLIQLGYDAKLKSLAVINALRKAKIPVYHSLTKDKLAAQLAAADSLKVPYIMIIGQKEALENSVVVRDVNTRSQETVEISKLGEYVRRLK